MAIYGNMVVPSKASAGALPTDNSDRTVYVPGGEVSGRFSDAGVQIAAQGAQQTTQALGNLGRGIGQLGGMFVDIYERNRRLDMAKAEEAYARLQIEGTEERTRLSRLKGANAIGADGKTLDVEAQWRDWYTKAKARHAQGLGDAGLRYFNLHADQFNAHQAAGVHSYFEQQLGQYEDTQLKFAMDAEGSALAANPFDSASAAASQGRIRGLIHQQAMRKGWTPEMEEQAFLAASGKAWGNAIAVRISMGDFDGAQALMKQYGASVSPEDQAKLRQAWSSGKMGLIASKAAAGDIDGVRRELGAGQGLGGSFDATIAARAAQFNGRKYGGVGGFDCSAYIRTIGKDQVPAQYQDIFAGSSEHMLDRAGELTGHLYRGGEVNAGTITSGGWLIGIAEPNAKHVRATKSERPNDIGHVAMTFMQNGVVMVTENASGRGVNSVPLAEYLDRYKGSRLFAANLNALPQGGGLPGGYKGVPSGWVEFQGDRTGSKAARQHNPGNIRHDGKNYDSYATDAEGWLDMANVLQKPGYRNLTIQQIAERYVNGKVGQAVVPEYLKAIQAQGFKLDEVPNLNDKMTLARLMKGMAVGESPLGKEYKVEQLYGLLTGGAQPQQQAPAQGVPAAPAPAGNLSDNAKAIYELMAQQVGDGRMTRQQAETRLQEMLQNAKAKMSSHDEPVRNMAKGDYKDIQDALAAFRQGQSSQAPAPVQGAQPVSAQAPAMPQAGAQQAQGMGAGFGFTLSEQQKAMNEFVPQAAANAIVDTARSKGGSMAQIKKDAIEQLEALPAGERDKYRPIVERRLADLEQNQLVQDEVLYEQTIKTLAGMSPRDREAFIAQMSASGKASPELVKKVRTWNSGVKGIEKESGEKWASEMRGRMDDHYAQAKTHSDALENEVRVKKMLGEITDETAQKLMEWSRTGGSRKNFTQETLKKLYNEGVPKAEWKDPPEDLVQRLWAQMRNAGDKPVGEDEIREMMRKEMLPTTTPYPGMMPFKKTEEVPYHQAMSEGRKVLGVKMDTEQIPQLKKEMEELARRRPDFKLNPKDPEDVKAYYAGKLGGKW